MSYCFNPACQKPHNPDDAKFCLNCGSSLILGDRYRAIKVLGQGGFGRTFLTIDEAEPDTPACVVKQSLPVHPTPLPHTKLTNLFYQEAEHLAQLGQHPQIPKLWNYFEQANIQYLVQEFIDGPNLETVLVEHGLFSEVEIWQVLLDLLPVLQFIHQHRVIHRDIKPENIICPLEDGRLFLVDFGASKYAATETTLARTGTVIGSAAYVAPEQAMGKAEFASDLFSLGVTCIHLLTGMHPFDLYSVSQDVWIWRQFLPKPISSKLRRVLDKLLQRATRQRYQTATEVLQDLGWVPEPEVVQQRALLPRQSAPAQIKKPPSRRYEQIVPEQFWQCCLTLTGHVGAVTAIALSPNGRTIASGSIDKTIKLWDLPSGDLLHTFGGRSLWFGNGHAGCITALAFTPDGQCLISASDDGTVKLWYLPELALEATLTGQGWGISAIALSPNAQLLASGGGDGRIQIWDLDHREPLGMLTRHQSQISSLVCSSDGQLLVSSSHDGNICLWELQTGCLLNLLKGHPDGIGAIALNPNRQTLISGSWDRTLKVWDVKTGEPLRTLAAHGDRITCVTFNPAGTLVASGSEDSSIHIWSFERSFRERPPIEIHRLCTLRHSWTVNTLAFSPNGQILVSGSADETIKIWQQK
jgi:WD40 repeat protein